MSLSKKIARIIKQALIRMLGLGISINDARKALITANPDATTEEIDAVIESAQRTMNNA
jgi:hypothetical protein